MGGGFFSLIFGAVEVFENKVMKESWASLKLVPHGVQWSKESSGAGGCGSEVGMGDGVREWAGVQWWRRK